LNSDFGLIKIDKAKNFNDSSVNPARKEKDSGSLVDQINKLFSKPAGKQIKHPRIKASTINFTGSLNLSDLMIKKRIANDGRKVSARLNILKSTFLFA
jgi:hypothetical protein